MLFQARRKPPFGDRLRQIVWPRSGWRRALHYIGHRLARLPGTPHAIAAGFACGVAISFTPFLGLHFLLAGLLAWALGANVIASAIGTAVGNPWTFPLIWIWIYQIGAWILGLPVETEIHGENGLANLMYGRLLPMVVGGVPAAVVAWLVSYWPMRYLVAGYHHARRARRQRLASAAADGAAGRRERTG